MKQRKYPLRDGCITLGILSLCFFASVQMQNTFHISEQITTTFAFGVFLISLLTDGYFYGLAAALAGVLLVNYAFTFPYFEIDFVSSSNFYSAVVMAVIALLTGALTTKIKQQEALKAESEKERMRANLLRAISHDLRSPLTTILGSSTLLRENRVNLTEEQQDRILRGIQEDAQWLVQMVENLLSVTRIDTGDVRITTIPTAADELIDSALVKFHSHYPNQQILLALPEEPVFIPMDPLLIQQVLINILENAVQHGIGLTKILLRLTVSNGVATFEITDDGCGISPDRLAHIFTGLYDSPALPADHAKRNAGIGLSVCATIIRAHGGTIHAENLPTGGAAFRFTLRTEELSDE